MECYHGRAGHSEARERYVARLDSHETPKAFSLPGKVVSDSTTEMHFHLEEYIVWHPIRGAEEKHDAIGDSRTKAMLSAIMSINAPINSNHTTSSFSPPYFVDHVSHIGAWHFSRHLQSQQLSVAHRSV